ncbi:MAG: hypothetical protein NT115_07980 [Proteobacteria bacterium]|nr:hypothetical protein [Pseudomonadota bacterium]
MPYRKQNGEARPCGRAANDQAIRTELPSQVIKVIGPDLVFRSRPVKRDFGCAAITAVMQQYAISRSGDILGQVGELTVSAPAAGGQGNPGSGMPDHFVINPDIANNRFGHCHSNFFRQT